MIFSKFLNKAIVRYALLLLILCVVYNHILFRVIEDPDSFMILKYLYEVEDLPHYFRKLLNYELLDFQPVRDLTLFIDIYLSKHLGAPTYAFQNLLWWVGCGYIVERIISNFSTRTSTLGKFVYVILFCLYPLFSNILPWGMARKHLLSFFFTAWATSLVTNNDFKVDLRNMLVLTALYALAILSQPINILLPLWIALYLYWYRGFDLVKTLLTSLPLGFVLLIVARFNYYYYETSKTFKYYYPPKTDSGTDPADRILALGYYFYELIYPYNFTMYPSLGSTGVFIGLIIFVVFVYLAIKWAGKEIALLWFTYMLLPLAVVLVSPKMLFDCYLLTPALGCFLLLYILNGERPIPKYVGIVAGIFFASYTYYEANFWKNPQALMRVSFERQPNCINAYISIRLNYEIERKASPEAKEFLETHDCDLGHGKTSYDVLTELTFLSNILYYEDDTSLSDRLAGLDRYGKMNYYPMLLKATLELKNGMTDSANQTIKEFEYLVKDTTQAKFIEKYHSEIGGILYPFCKKQQYKVCEAYAGRYANKAFRKY